MDEAEGLHLRVSSEDSVPLPSFLAEPINLEDSHYVQLRGDLELDAQNLEAESWSLAVDQNYLKALSKEAVKRQDVIYELIQTEMHHVRTLKTTLHVYMHELKQSLIIDEARLERLFPRVEALLSLHQHFLNCLKERQIQSQEETDTNNYYITQLGDILINQFSGLLGEQMMDSYSVFCSHHSEAIGFYKDQMQNNKKLQILIRKIGQLPLVRRLGIPECFLLVTQRITKYPILVERLIQNTEADTDEYKSLVKGLGLIKDTIYRVDALVSEYEKAARLREISHRLEPKVPGRLKDGRMFRREDLLQGNRILLHEGTVTWKVSGRQKDVVAVLLTDVLLLLQEKDQKFVFANMENKPSVISLERLIVREVAHEDKAMYLICACTTSMPEMYEIHTSSKEECHTWTTLIREAADYLREQVQLNELITTLQDFQDVLKLKDDQIKQSLTEKQQIFTTLYKYAMMQESPKGLLLRGDTTDLQQGETLLNGAIDEMENLQNLLFMIKGDSNLLMEKSTMQGGVLGGEENFEAADDIPVSTTIKNGSGFEKQSCEDISVDSKERSCDHLHVEQCYSQGLQQSAGDETDSLSMINCISASNPIPGTAVYNSVMRLSRRLYSLKAVIAQQDSMIELQQAFQFKNKQSVRQYSNMLLEQEKQRNLEKQKEELANLHKLKTQHREEQQRWEKERERQMIQMEVLEAQLKQKEEESRRWEAKLNEEKSELDRQRENYQQDLKRLREVTRTVDKENERLVQEKERLEKLKSKLIPTSGFSRYDDPFQSWSHSPYSSFRGSVVNGAGTQKPHGLTVNHSSLTEIPPKVPPRGESISPKPATAELPSHLISTTNQVQKPAVVLQKIPTKLAKGSKGKEKSFKGKGSHQRAHSAASIDVSQVLPIRGTVTEGGSLKVKRHASPQRVLTTDTFRPPGPAHNIKSSQSFRPNKQNSSDPPPPIPPPFPTEIRDTFRPPGPAHNIKSSQSFRPNKQNSSDPPPPIPPPFPTEIRDTFRPPGPAHNIKSSQSFRPNKQNSSDPPPPIPPPFPTEIRDTFRPPGPAHNIKSSQSFRPNKQNSSDPPPPIPPPFPTEIRGKRKEKVIFL
ncbi:rho guanine nucleotide exchange factor 18a [Melanotaenia boesemani]|uniref:rho guanine nucleotide exchange factor 18a n=1 Tax=Melanotaenia boesemani TaxID=1250792 RepID=UPI001C05D0BF|nr:rho guanine nucleotide exchange factor 18a [Melanotaenia boesemani]XP_041849627.1 rho guanine nucleotide exchange factor 18a [Melanotaenia boesemani]